MDRFALRFLWRAQRLVIITATLLLVVLVAAVAALPDAGTAPQGPLMLPTPHGWLLEDARVGHQFTDGLELLDVQGTAPITVTDVRSIGGGNGLELIGLRVAGDARKSLTHQYTPRFPPRGGRFGPLREVLDESLPSSPGPQHGSWQLLLGYEVTRPGIWERTALEIDYVTDGRSYTARFPSALLVCTRGHKQECNKRFEPPGY